MDLLDIVEPLLKDPFLHSEQSPKLAHQEFTDKIVNNYFINARVVLF